MFSNKTQWKLFYEFRSQLTESEVEEFMNYYTYLPYKGSGFIQVDDVDKAMEFLADYVGEFEMGYYPEGFLTDSDVSDEIYYGKFEIENLPVFIERLAKKVKIIDMKIQPRPEWGY